MIKHLLETLYNVINSQATHYYECKVSNTNKSFLNSKTTITRNMLMVQNSQIAGHDLVLQHGPGGDVDPVPVVGDDDHRPPQTDSSPEGDVPRHGEVVQLQHVGDGPEPGEEGGDLLEVPASFTRGVAGNILLGDMTRLP